MADGVYNQFVAEHENGRLRVGHDIFLRWYVVKDNKWKMIKDAATRKAALDAAHGILHEGEACPQVLKWDLDESTMVHVLGECPKCLNPALDSDLKTYRLCPDCGWRIEFTEEEVERLENRLASPSY